MVAAGGVQVKPRPLAGSHCPDRVCPVGHCAFSHATHRNPLSAPPQLPTRYSAVAQTALVHARQDPGPDPTRYLVVGECAGARVP